MGQWIKNGDGRVTISLTPNSTAQLYVEFFSSGINSGLIAGGPIDPGHSQTFNPGNGYTIRYTVNGRNFLGASDVQGGTDCHFEGVWVTTRYG